MKAHRPQAVCHARLPSVFALRARPVPVWSPLGNRSQQPRLPTPPPSHRLLRISVARGAWPYSLLSWEEHTGKEIRATTFDVETASLFGLSAIPLNRPWISGLCPPLLWPRVLIFSTRPWTFGLHPPFLRPHVLWKPIMSFMPILPCVFARRRPSSPINFLSGCRWQRIAAASAFTA